MLIAAASETRWRVARIFSPLLDYGRRSYEVYLTHMFVVFACFNVFLWAGKPMWLVLPLFLTVIVLSGALGELVARFFSDPANRWLRACFASRARSAGSLLGAD
jgi:peptidoglycan/LPS O-acetylase OafA/YrhL